jgi:methionine-rich copper-binding protein CopC
MKSIGGKTFCFCFLFILFQAAGFFISPKTCLGENESVRINELFPNPFGDDDKEFIELYNESEKDIDISKWKVKDDTKTGKYIFPDKTEIKSGGYIVVYKEKFKFALDNTGEEKVYLFDEKGEDVDTISYKNSIEGSSYNYSSEEWYWNILPTPGEKNSEKSKPKEYSSKIRINEILPNPSGDESKDEYIELYNYSNEDIDLENWEMRDSGSVKYELPKNTEIKKGKYLAIYRKDFKFAINNSNETIYLFNPNGVEVSKVLLGNKSFDSDISYGFDGVGWKRSSFLTPEKENEFDEATKIKIKKDDRIYRNIYANFEVKTRDKKQKVTWDFGDGSSKSYLQKTKHKYLKTGIFEVVLTVKGKSDDLVENFTVEVEKFEQSKIKIISVRANPKGKDSKESITIQNNSKKKINFKNWSIATGWDSLYNHPITKKLVLKPGEKKEITKKYSKFTLNNKQTKIELRRPDGSAAAKIKYSKKEGIQDDEVYEKGENGWKWAKEESVEDEKDVDVESEEGSPVIEPLATEGVSEEILEENPDNNKNDQIEDNSEIQSDEPTENGEPVSSADEKVLGSETIKENIDSNNKIRFFQTIFWKTNQSINQFINLIIDYF